MSRSREVLLAVLFLLLTAVLIAQSWRLGLAEVRVIDAQGRTELLQQTLGRCQETYAERAEELRLCRLGSNLRPASFETDFFGLRYQGDASDFIDYNVLRFGAFEKPLLFLLRDVAKALEASSGARPSFLDIGANVGHHSLYMSRFAGRILAVEPYPPVVKRFRDMVELNKVQNIEIAPVALGAERDKLRFQPPPEHNHGGGSFRDVDQRADSSAELPEVEVLPGDDLLAERRFGRVDILKMDIEGFEKPALAGLRATLARDRPVVLLEVTFLDEKPLLFRSFTDLRAALPENYQLRAVNYDVDGLESGHYQLAPPPAEHGQVIQWDLLLYPEERSAALDKLQG